MLNNSQMDYKNNNIFKTKRKETIKLFGQKSQHFSNDAFQSYYDLFTTKSDKGNRVVILDQELYNNAMEEIISHSSKFEKLNEDSTLKREASLQRFLRKLKQKDFFNEIEYDKLYPSGSAPTCIYGTP